MQTNTFAHLDGSTLRIGIVAARFNQNLTDAMLADCVNALTACEVKESNMVTVRVPGAFELPVAAATLADRRDLDAIICLGVLIKGETRHDHYIADACANGIMNVALSAEIPVLFGVLTTENLAQAESRSLGAHKKGWETGMSAVEMALTMKAIS